MKVQFKVKGSKFKVAKNETRRTKRSAGAFGKGCLRFGQYLGPLIVILLRRDLVRAIKLQQLV